MDVCMYVCEPDLVFDEVCGEGLQVGGGQEDAVHAVGGPHGQPVPVIAGGLVQQIPDTHMELDLELDLYLKFYICRHACNVCMYK